MRKKPVVLCILDGWGLTEDKKYSAIAKANVPNFNSYIKQYPNSKLNASGEFVGLPDGQMGNSEVGHTNIGAGRIVMQDLPMINRDVANNSVKDRPIIKDMVKKMQNSGGAMHLMGLLSDGGVHSHINHIINFARTFGDAGVKVYLHLLLDGRDVAQKSALTYIKKLYDELDKDYPNMFIATVGGRYYGMDRDKRWDRVEKAYNSIVLGECDERFKTAMDCVNSAYSKDITDEFVVPAAIRNYEGMNDNDGFIFCNFRADRAREITEALGK